MSVLLLLFELFVASSAASQRHHVAFDLRSEKLLQQSHSCIHFRHFKL